MKNCECRCDTNIDVQKLERYETAMFGIKMALVNSVVEETCNACGQKSIVIPDQGGLIAAAALTRIKAPLKLRGHEIRFVRKAMNISSKDFSKIMGVTGETFSRWEHDKLPITPANEKLLRLLACICLEDKAPAIDVDRRDLARMHFKAIGSKADEPVMVFERVKIKQSTLSEAYSEGKAA